jgi:hypothetical protein
MTTNFTSETWKTVKFDFDFEFTNDFTLEVSSQGRVRSTNNVSDKRILKGTSVDNYRTIKLKLYKPRDVKFEKRIRFYKEKFAEIKKKLSLLNADVKTRITHDSEVKREADSLQELLVGLRKKYRKEFKADLKARTINLTLLVRRLVAEYFCEKPSAEHEQVANLDHNRTNNRAYNLKWMTKDELNIHIQKSPYVKAAKGLNKGKRNEDSESCKLTSTKVMIIKKRLSEGKTLRLIAKQFKVTPMQISRIKNEQNWKNIEPAL